MALEQCVKTLRLGGIGQRLRSRWQRGSR